MYRVTSKDGTSIAHPGGRRVRRPLGERALAAELARQFTVYSYHRRGRGQSGDTLPYAVDRELEDIEALIAVAGRSAHLYGASSGGALALQAAAAEVAGVAWP
jgi:pimeloyl-ACP methyl ester carboxylesterase